MEYYLGRMLGLILLLFSILSIGILFGDAEGKTITVDDDGEADFETIQDAVDAADERDTIRVSEGMYDELVTIEKSILLLGDNQGNVYVNSIILKNSGNNEISNITVNHISLVEGTHRNTISNCSFIGNYTEGIFISDSTQNTLDNCSFDISGKFGIRAYETSQNLIKSCTFENRSIALFLFTLEEFLSHDFFSNTVNNKPLIVIKNQTSFTIDDEAGQIIIMNCSDAVVKNINISNATIPLHIIFSSKIKVLDCEFSSNYGGIRLSNCRDCTIQRCSIFSNEWIALLGADCYNISIDKCDVLSNQGTGLYFSNSRYSMISNCTFSSNNEFYSAAFIGFDSNYNTIKFCSFSENEGEGLKFHENSNYNSIVASNFTNNLIGIKFIASSHSNTINQCNFSGNIEYGVEVGFVPDEDFNAIDNWWGATSGPYHPTLNPTGKGDEITNYVLFDPWIGKSRTWYVDDDAPPGGNGSLPHPFSRIQDAIDNATDGDIIRVFEGEYYENVIVNKSVSLIGNGSRNTSLDGGDSEDVVRIEADWCSVSGFNIIQSGEEFHDAGIEIMSSSNTITNNTIQNNGYYSIYIHDSDSNTIASNIIRNNSEEGFHLRNSNFNNIFNNTIHNNGDIGIYLQNSDSSTIVNNTIKNNDEFAIYLGHSNSNVIENNTLQNNTDDGLLLWNSDSNSVAHNTIQHNGDFGVTLHELSTSNVISNNSIQNNNNSGIEIERSDSNIILNNTIRNNEGSGINIDDSVSTNIESNIIHDNGEYGVDLQYSSLTIISNNTIGYNHTDGIYFLGSFSNIIANNTIQFNIANGVEIDVSNSNIIENNTVQYNNKNGIQIDGSDSNIIENNTIRYHNKNGIFLYNSDSNTIYNDTISHNEVGIYLGFRSEENTAHHNRILKNTGYGINASDSNGYTINATHNWWGSNSGPYHSTLNPNGRGDNVTDFVIYDPWTGKPDTFYVDDDASPGGEGSLSHPFQVVQDAINVSIDGDIIRVFSGIFYENVIVNKSVSLIGNGSEVTTIDGGGNGDVVNITADWVNMSGFYITGGGSNWWNAGIKVQSQNNKIHSNNCTRNVHGIFLDSANHNNLSDNICLFNTVNGIYLHSSELNTVMNNICTGNDLGISLWLSHTNTFNNNTCSSNGMGIKLFEECAENVLIKNSCSNNDGSGISLDYSSDQNNIISYNTCLNNGYYGISIGWGHNIISNNICSNNYRGIHSYHLWFSTISNNTCSNNEDGIWIEHVINAIVTGNTCNANTAYGIFIDSPDDTLIKNNTCTSNQYDGIHVFDATESTITNNTCSQNVATGIYLDEANHCSIRNNTCENNGNAIHFRKSSNNILANNILMGSDQDGKGIDLSDSCNNNTLSNNYCSYFLYGIDLWKSDHNTLSNNSCLINKIGIIIRDSNNNSLLNNTCTSNDYAIALENSISHNFNNNIMLENSISIIGFNLENYNTHTIYTTNTVNGSPVYYYQDSSGITVPSGAGQIILANCTKIVVENQNCSNGSIGILIAYSSNLTIANNTCNSNSYSGIFLSKANFNTFSNNTCSNNSNGVYLSNSNINTFSNNICSSNYRGIILSHSSQRNVFINNTCNSNKHYGMGIRESDFNNLSNNIFSFNYDEGIISWDSNNNTLTNNSCNSNWDFGISLHGSNDCTLRNNTISENGVGIYLRTHSLDNTAHYNTINNNSDFGIQASLNDGHTITATHNWWGDNTGPYHPTLNPKGKGNSVTDNVIFEPWIGKTTTWYVDDDAPPGGNGSLPHPFSSIQDAIGASQNGDTIKVYDGTYYENVVVNKTVSLIGNGSDTTTIIGNGERGGVVTIHSDNTYFSGFTINCDGAGISSAIAIYSNNNTINNNVCTNCYNGILIYKSSINNIVANNFVHLNNIGILVRTSDSNSFMNNYVSHNNIGFYVFNSSENNFTENQIVNNVEYGVRHSTGIKTSKNNTFRRNSISGNGELGIQAYSNSGRNLDARYNWWGDNSGPYNGINNVNGKGDNVTDNVLFEPWLTEEDVTIYVDDDALPGGDGSLSYPFRSIQDAIDNASFGDSIRVFNGTYYERIRINKTVNVFGNGSDVTSIQSWASAGGIVELIADRITISGFHITNEENDLAHIGILVLSDDNIISWNTIMKTDHGLYFENSNKNLVENNICIDNGQCGILLDTSNYNIIRNNVFSGNLYGIRISSSNDNLVENNSCAYNLKVGIRIFGSNNQTLSQNNCSYNKYGIEIDSSYHCFIRTNIFDSNEQHGILVEYSHHIEITNNVVLNNSHGVRLLAATNVSTKNNIISLNVLGIIVEVSTSNNLFRNNTIKENSIYGMTVTANQGSFIDAINNYWGHPSGPFHSENNSNGLGDNITDYVLFEPWLDKSGNIVNMKDIPHDDDPDRIPLYILIGILVALFSALVIVIRTPRNSTKGKMSQDQQLHPAEPTWDSSDDTETKGKLVSCEYCHETFEVAKSDGAIRVTCTHCGKNTLNHSPVD